jgi:hypothetical protein
MSFINYLKVGLSVIGLLLAVLDFTNTSHILERILDKFILQSKKWNDLNKERYIDPFFKQPKSWNMVIPTGPDFLAWGYIYLFKFMLLCLHVLNMPKKGIVGSIGLLLAIIGVFM